jgi:type VI protein secretion system component Hcp
MTVDGIPGSIDLTLNSWATVNTGGMAAPTFYPFVVSKAIDAHSAALLNRFFTSQHTTKVTIELLQPGSEDVYSKYVLTDVVIVGFNVTGDAAPLERLDLDAKRVESTVPLPGGGTARSCWDRVTNSSC